MPRSGFETRKADNIRRFGRKDQPKKSFRKRSIDAPTFNDIPPEELATLICLCTTHNANPTFSYTRDGTSMVIAMYYENERQVDYLGDVEDFREYLRWVATELLEAEQGDLDQYPFFAPKKA